MKLKELLFVGLQVCILQNSLYCQDIPQRNQFRAVVCFTILEKNEKEFEYQYTIKNLKESKQGIWLFSLILSQSIDVYAINSPRGWDDSYGKVETKGYAEMNWGTGGDFDILPDSLQSGFSFHSSSVPGIITHYLEGYAPPPNIEKVDLDSLGRVFGYDDLTPYGPGIVGKTVGPVLPPEPFIATAFLDTLLSYTRQSAELGWLGKERDDDCDEDEQPDDGLIRNLEQRLTKAKRELMREDSVKARRELEKLVKKVERIWKRSQEEANRGRKGPMTSEAYALLKYNTEYLIERLPEKKGK